MAFLPHKVLGGFFPPALLLALPALWYNCLSATSVLPFSVMVRYGRATVDTRQR